MKMLVVSIFVCDLAYELWFLCKTVYFVFGCNVLCLA